MPLFLPQDSSTFGNGSKFPPRGQIRMRKPSESLSIHLAGGRHMFHHLCPHLLPRPPGIEGLSLPLLPPLVWLCIHFCFLQDRDIPIHSQLLWVACNSRWLFGLFMGKEWYVSLNFQIITPTNSIKDHCSHSVEMEETVWKPAYCSPGRVAWTVSSLNWSYSGVGEKWTDWIHILESISDQQST